MRYFICNVVFLLILTGDISAQQWLWAERTGATEPQNEAIDEQYSVETDSAGYVYVAYRCGVSGSPSFQIFQDNDTTWVAVHGDAFISKYDSTGHRLWSRPIFTLDTATQSSFLAPFTIQLSDMAVQSNGNIYITGIFQGTNLLFGSDTISSTTYNNSDIFIAKLDSAMTPIWIRTSTRLSNLQGFPSELKRICLDDVGNLIAGGSIRDTILLLGDTLYGNFATNLTSAIVMRLDASGSLLWDKVIECSNPLLTKAVAIDDSGNVYCSAPLYGFVIEGLDTLNGTGTTSFVMKFDSLGNYQWMTETIKVDDLDYDNNFLYCGGCINDTLVIGNTTYFPFGSNDAALTALTSMGHHSALYHVRGSLSSQFTDIFVHDSSILAVGFYLGDLFWDSVAISSVGSYDIFIAQFEIGDSLRWLSTAGSLNSDALINVTGDREGRIYVSGTLYDSTVHLGNIVMDVEYRKDCFLSRILEHQFCGFIAPYTLQDTAVCSNGSIILSAAPGFLSYHWSSGQTTQLINVNSSQIYTYYALDSGGCFYQGPLYNVTVEPEFIIWPSVTGDTLFSSDWYHIQWLLNGAHYASTNDGLIIPTQPGWYCAVDTTNRFYCSDTSNCVYWNPANIEVHSDFEPLVSPNPASEVINVVGENIVQWSIMDMSGRVVSIGTESEDSFSISLVNLTDGIYVLSVYNSQGEVARKKVIVR